MKSPEDEFRIRINKLCDFLKLTGEKRADVIHVIFKMGVAYASYEKERMLNVSDEEIKKWSDNFYRDYTTLKPGNDNTFTYAAKALLSHLKQGR